MDDTTNHAAQVAELRVKYNLGMMSAKSFFEAQQENDEITKMIDALLEQDGHWQPTNATSSALIFLLRRIHVRNERTMENIVPKYLRT